MKSLLFALLLVVVFAPCAFAAENESVYDRVMRTGTIRCGYFTWAPFLMKDPNTGEFSGIYHDVIEALGKQLNLKIEWAEDTGQSNPFEGMKTGRFDMFCGPITPTPDRAKQAAFSAPFFYIPYLAYARIDDSRFDDDLRAINNPDVKIAVIDGEFAYEIVKRDFPNAGLLSLPAMSDGSQVMLSVTTKKADVFLNDAAAASVFIEKNPNQVKPVSHVPLRTLAAVIVLPQHDFAFKNMIDTVLQLFSGDKVVEEVLGRYSTQQDMFLLPSVPYKEVTK
jgi:polar amino acid transport system substrate-binding protein